MIQLACPDVPGMVVKLHVRSWNTSDCSSSLLFNIHKFIHNKPPDDLKETFRQFVFEKLHFEESKVSKQVF